MAEDYSDIDVDTLLAAEMVRKAENLVGTPTFFKTGDDPGAFSVSGSILYTSILGTIKYSKQLEKYIEGLEERET